MSGNVTPVPYPYKPIAGSGQHGVSLAAAVGLTPPNGALYAVLQANGGDVRYTTDGTTPTTSLGMTLSSGATLTLSGYAVIAAFLAISTAGTLDVEFYQ